jgi:hypothetical protein
VKCDCCERARREWRELNGVSNKEIGFGRKRCSFHKGHDITREGERESSVYEWD